MQFCVSTFAQNPYIRHYTTLDGLPSNTIYQMCQDSHKFLWFTSNAGVVKFDGTNFTSYRKKDGLSSNDVVRIKEDFKGRIWFFNYNATVNYYYNNKIYNGGNSPFLDSLTGIGFFLDFFTDSDQTLNFYNWQREVFSLDTNNKVQKHLIFRNVNYKLPVSGYNNDVIRVSYLSKSLPDELTIWASTGIYKENIPQERISASDTNLRCKDVFLAPNNTYYVNTYYEGILKITGDFQKEKISFPGNSQKIRTILEDSDGFLWIAVFDDGVFCLKNNKVVRHFNFKDAQGLLQDHEKNIWVSTESDGVYVINHDLLTQNHFDRTNFDNYGVNQLCDFSGMGIWCTNTKAAYLLKNNAFYKLSVPRDIEPLNILYLFKDKTLLLGSISYSLSTFENIRLNVVSKEISYRKRMKYLLPVKRIIDDRTGLLTTLFDQSRILFAKSSNPSLNSEYRISERINNAYYNTDNELVINAKRNYLFRNHQLEKYTELSRFDGTVISDHLFLNDSVEMINIDGDSLFLFSDHRFYNLTRAFNTPIPLQIGKALYNDSTLYVSTLKDIFVCINPINVLAGRPVQIKSLNINFNNINDILIIRDSLYIASDDGLTIIPVSSLTENIAAPPVPYIRSVTVNDINYSLPLLELKLTGKNNIHLTFGCISYFSSSATYSYMLEGAENKWSVGIGNEVDLYYRNLPPGNYSFKLRVRKSNSNWSNPLVLRIIIKPTLVEYPLFWAVIVLFATGIIFLIFYMIRIQKMKRVEVDYQLVVMEQKALQSMMNPHFIFNSLGSIQNYLLKNKGSEAIIYLSNFARLIRQNLNAINTPMILLDEEVDRLKNYLELEKIRLENKFEYSIEIDKVFEEDDVYIPGMIIQPIVENSIWHGIATLKVPGNIIVSFKANSTKSLRIRIEDNGVGMTQSMEYFHKDANRQHLGMNIIEKRLNLLSKKYTTKTSIRYSESYPGNINPGTLVELIVPFTYSTSDS
jgi:two-component sensor histidine kinase